MNYKEKYEELKSKAKTLHKLACETSYENTRMAIEELFPELKESKDERVRKEVIDVLKLNIKGAESQMQASKGVNRTFEVYACNKVITWLEKQGKQKPTWSEEDERYYDSALWHIKVSSGTEGKAYNWLKSIKERLK